MTVSTSTESWSTKVVVFGVCGVDENEFLLRLKSAENAIKHPMIFPGLFAELQRKRHTALVTSSVTALLQNMLRLEGSSSAGNQRIGHASDLLEMWIDITYLSSSLETWKAQLTKMVSHIDELNSAMFPGNAQLVPEGNRIKERLLDIIVEYEELRRKCALVIDGTSLANGMVSMPVLFTSLQWSTG